MLQTIFFCNSNKHLASFQHLFSLCTLTLSIILTVPHTKFFFSLGASSSKSAEFAPTNLAVNFRRPDRFRSEMEAADVDGSSAGSSAKRLTASASKEAEEVVTRSTVVVGQVPMERRIGAAAAASVEGAGSAAVTMSAAAAAAAAAEKATDDLHLTKFKQHFQRK